MAHLIKMADSMTKKDATSPTKIKKKHTPGIVYLSRLPPFMRPAKVRNIFSKHGEVGRIFLQPEDTAVRKQRKKYGGNGRKLFTEGWIEFKDKRIARAVALSFNNTIIGGKKRGYYHDDIWNIKYLPKFLWNHLCEKIAYEKATKEQLMRTEISQAKKEANFYVENVEKGKTLEAIETRKRKRNDQKPVEKKLRTFKQHQTLQVDEAIVANPGDRSTGKDVEKSISRDLLRKVFPSATGR